MLARASYRPPDVTLEQVLERADRITREVADRRDHVHLETAWPTLTRLIHDFMGDRLDTDVDGAKAAGMTAVWFNPNQERDASHRADFVVTDWDEFRRAVLQAAVPL